MFQSCASVARLGRDEAHGVRSLPRLVSKCSEIFVYRAQLLNIIAVVLTALLNQQYITLYDHCQFALEVTGIQATPSPHLL